MSKEAARGDQLAKALSRLVAKASPHPGPGSRILDTEKLNTLVGGDRLVRGEAGRAQSALQGMLNKARSGERDSLSWGLAVPYAFGRTTNPYARAQMEMMNKIYSAKPGSTDTLWGRNIRDIRKAPDVRSLAQYRLMRDTASKLSVG